MVVVVVVEGVALFFGDFSRHFKMFPNVFLLLSCYLQINTFLT